MSNADTYIAAGLIALSIATILTIALLRPSYPDPEPDTDDTGEPDGPACMVTHPNPCPHVATHNDWGWLTCDTHAPRRAA